MKYLYLFLFVTTLTFAQSIKSHGEVGSVITNQSPFLDASSFSSTGNNAKGLLFPSTNLTSFQFVNDGNAFGFSTFYDGMIVFNTATGKTPAAGAGVKSGIGNQDVVPGFYYFSNPTKASVVGNGSWLPLGGVSSAVKESVVQVVIGSGNATATLDLDTTTATTTPTLISGALLSSTSTFLEAKIYSGSNTTGELKLSATGNYDKSTNILTTGNGLVYQVLPEGTYTVVLSYK